MEPSERLACFLAMDSSAESFEQFKQSFWYGSRSDLGFKFLASLCDEDAAEFLRQLLELLGDVFDTGEHDRIRDLVYTWQVRAYDGDGHAKFNYDDGAFAQVDRPLRELTVALLSAGGVYLEHDDPAEGETQAQAEARIDDYLRTEPVLVEIPHDTPTDQLRVRHPGYDVRGARRDVNAVFPIDALRQLDAEGAVRAAAHHYGFVGACSQLQLRKTIAPEWAERMAATEVDACLLVAT
jgi:D-proline reductase (dithiol) PrdB